MSKLIVEGYRAKPVQQSTVERGYQAQPSNKPSGPSPKPSSKPALPRATSSVYEKK